MKVFRISVSLVLLICALFMLTGSTASAASTWINRTASPGVADLSWHALTSSADGTKLAAVVDVGDVWTSSDSGQHWTNQTTETDASGLFWKSIASSQDGTKLAAVESVFYTGVGDVWTSTDSGQHWTNVSTTTTHLSGQNLLNVTSSATAQNWP